MSLTGIRNELESLKKEVAPGYKSIEELLKSDLRYLSDYELYRLIRNNSIRLKSEPELTEDQFKSLSDSELMEIIESEDL